MYEPKFDGYRALVFSAPGPAGQTAVTIQTRAGNIVTRGFPDIAAAIEAQVPPGVVLDGELVVWDGHGVNFAALAGRLASTRKSDRIATQQPASLMVFDVLAVAGQDVRHLPLLERRTLLEAVLADCSPPIQLVPSTRDVSVARDWLDDYTSTPGLGIEGVVVKAAAEPYASGRRGWLKYRVRHTHDVIVGAVLGRVDSPARLVLGYYGIRGGRVSLRVAGATVPLGARQSRALGRMLTPHTSGSLHPWAEDMPAAWLGQWGRTTARGSVKVSLVDPQLVVEVSADTAFEYGRWRHMVRFVRARPDRDAASVRAPG